jgi:putative membrane protein
MFRNMTLAAVVGSIVCCWPVLARTSNSHKSDAAFLDTVAQSDMTIVHIGKIAEERAEASNLKDFAKMLVQDHTKDYEELTALAAKSGDKIPTAIDKQNNQTISKLDKDKGKTFDHAFLSAEATEHEKLLSAFKHEANHGSNPDIKAYANKVLPNLERHLHTAEDLSKHKS